MTTPARRTSRLGFPELPDWFESFTPRLAWPPLADLYTVRIEECTKEGRYEVRAEIPGIDPAKDLEVTVEDGVLSIKAERTERTEEKHRSEFRYGSFTRAVALPAGADEDDIKADYSGGILTISVGMGEQKQPVRHVEITSKD